MTEPMQPAAARSGAHATDMFKHRMTAVEASEERVSAIVSDVLAGLFDVVRKHDITYAEYDVLKAWLIKVGEDGEWPLWLDVFVEHEVEAQANRNKQGTAGSIEGPYYVPDAPQPADNRTMPVRADEAGTRLLFQGQVRAVDGTPLTGARIELWQADDDGYYSFFAEELRIPDWNLRGTFTADEDGRFAIDTIKPAPYAIPTDGATGQMTLAAGWSPFRPAHLHLKVSHPGHQLITSQLYFVGGQYTDMDIAQATKPALMLDPTPRSDGGEGEEVTYDFVLDPDEG